MAAWDHPGVETESPRWPNDPVALAEGDATGAHQRARGAHWFLRWARCDRGSAPTAGLQAAEANPDLELIQPIC